MTGEPLDRLDPDVSELLRAAEPYPEAPRGVQARAWTALASRIAAAGAAASSGASGESPDTVADQGVPAASLAPKTSGFVALAARPLRTIAGTFVVGAAVGAAFHAVIAPPRERIVYVEKPAPTAPRPTPIEPERVAAPVALPSAATPHLPPTAVASPPPRRAAASAEHAERVEKQPRGASDLGAEQALLDTARRALARGLPDDALAPLDRHAQRFSEGILAEEREALAVNVLVSLGRYPEARARADRFFQRYPRSLLRGSVEAALGAIPK